MIWRKHKYDDCTEYSFRSGPIAFWINEDDGMYDTVIHYGGKTETVVFSNLEEAKLYCRSTAICLLQETMEVLQNLSLNDWEPV